MYWICVCLATVQGKAELIRLWLHAALAALDLAMDHCCPEILDVIHSLSQLTALTLPGMYAKIMPLFAG